MKKETLLASMPRMVLIITMVVMLGSLFGAVSYLLKTPKTDLPVVNPIIEEVVVMTDKTEYETGEIVKMKIKNNSNKDLTYVLAIESFENGGWDKIVEDTRCDCGFNNCVKLELFVEAKSERKYPWNQEWGLCDELLLGQKLRVEMIYGEKRKPGEGRKGDSKIIYSNEFTIKEKSAVDTSNWQIYRNEEFGFEVKYPEELEMYETEVVLTINNNQITCYEISFFEPERFYVTFIRVFKIDQGETAKEFFDKIHKVQLTNVTKGKKTIAGIEAEYYKNIPGHDPYDEAFFVYNNHFYEIVRYVVKEDIFDQILSSFKFTNQNTSISDIIKENKKIEYLKDFEFQNLPDYVFPEQKGETYKSENYIFQFIKQPNLNTPLSISSNDIKYKGVLYSKDNGLSWDDFFAIDNPIDYDGKEVKYNPVGMFTKDNKFYIDIANDKGAGSGEGYLLRYYTEDGTEWKIGSCLYLHPEIYFINQMNGENGIDPFTITGDSGCVYSPVSLCTDEPFGEAIGSDVYPIDPKYKKLHFLGQLFTQGCSLLSKPAYHSLIIP